MSTTPLFLSDAVMAFMGVARSVAVGTSDAHGIPYGTRVAAMRVNPDRQSITAFVATATSAPLLRNLADNPRVAVMLSSPLDHRTLQFKGRLQAAGDADPADEGFIREFIAALGRVVDQFGMPASRVRQMRHWPAVALVVSVEQVFLQTPGPGAGQPLTGRIP